MGRQWTGRQFAMLSSLFIVGKCFDIPTILFYQANATNKREPGREPGQLRARRYYNRVVLAPRNGWMRSGSAVDAQRMHSGCTTGVQRYDCCG